MPLPTEQQKAEAIAALVMAVGSESASAYEVSLSLDARFPGMTDAEFCQLQIELQDDIATARAEALHDLWVNQH
jgi:hypothetical protein